MSEVPWRRGGARHRKSREPSGGIRCSSSMSSISSISSKFVEVKKVVRLTIRRSFATILPISEGNTKSTEKICSGIPKSTSFMQHFAPSLDSITSFYSTVSSIDSHQSAIQYSHSEQKDAMRSISYLEEYFNRKDEERSSSIEALPPEILHSKQSRENPQECASTNSIEKNGQSKPQHLWIDDLDCTLSFNSSEDSIDNHLWSECKIRRDDDFNLNDVWTSDALTSSNNTILRRWLEAIRAFLRRLLSKFTTSEDPSAMVRLMDENRFPTQSTFQTINYSDMLYITDVLLQESFVI